MVPYEYDYRIYLLAKTLDCIRDMISNLKYHRPLNHTQPRMDYDEIFNRNFQDMANYYNLTTNEQKLDLLNYIITHNFYFEDIYEENEFYVEYPQPIMMSEFISNQIWDVIDKHLEWFSLKLPPDLI